MKMQKENMMEMGFSSIEKRLSNVEDTLKTILEKGDLMEENLQEKMEQIQEEIERNAKVVRRMQRKLTQYQPRTIVLIIVGIVILWTIVLRFSY